jgi:hypothetical protein
MRGLVQFIAKQRSAGNLTLAGNLTTNLFPSGKGNRIRKKWRSF